MNKKIYIVGGAAAAGVLAATIGAVCVVAMNCSLSHACQIEFCYQDGVPSKTAGTHGGCAREAIGLTIQNRYRGLLFEFSDKPYFPLPFEKMVQRCLSAPELEGESERRTRAVLSTMRFEVIGMPSTNFAYQCRLVLTDPERQNIDKYARICLAMLRERLDEDCRLRADKTVINEVQRMRKAEKRIEELEKSLAQGSIGRAAEEELLQARSSVKETGVRIEEIRRNVMDTNERRITHESPPEVFWVIRREGRKAR